MLRALRASLHLHLDTPLHVIDWIKNVRALHVEPIDEKRFFVRAETLSGTVSGFSFPLPMLPRRPLVLTAAITVVAAPLRVIGVQRGSLTVTPVRLPNFTLKQEIHAQVACDDSKPTLSISITPFGPGLTDAARRALLPAPAKRVMNIARREGVPIAEDIGGTPFGEIVNSFDEEVSVLRERAGSSKIALVKPTHVIVGWVASADLNSAPTARRKLSAREKSLLDQLSAGAYTPLSSVTPSAAASVPGSTSSPQATADAGAIDAGGAGGDPSDAGLSPPRVGTSNVSCPVAVRAFVRVRAREGPGAVWLVGSFAPGELDVSATMANSSSSARGTGSARRWRSRSRTCGAARRDRSGPRGCAATAAACAAGDALRRREHRPQCPAAETDRISRGRLGAADGGNQARIGGGSAVAFLTQAARLAMCRARPVELRGTPAPSESSRMRVRLIVGALMSGWTTTGWRSSVHVSATGVGHVHGLGALPCTSCQLQPSFNRTIRVP